MLFKVKHGRSADQELNHSVFDLVGLFLKLKSLDKTESKDIEEDANNDVGVPWLGTQLIIVDEGSLNGIGNVSVEGVLVVLISVVVMDEASLVVVVSPRNGARHFNNLVNVESCQIQVLKEINGVRWWRSVNPLVEGKVLGGTMGVNLVSGSVSFVITSFLPMVACNLKLANGASFDSFFDSIKRFYNSHDVTEVCTSIRETSDVAGSDIGYNYKEEDSSKFFTFRLNDSKNTCSNSTTINNDAGENLTKSSIALAASHFLTRKIDGHTILIQHGLSFDNGQTVESVHFKDTENFRILPSLELTLAVLHV